MFPQKRMQQNNESAVRFLRDAHYNIDQVLAGPKIKPKAYCYLNPKNFDWLLRNQSPDLMYRVDGIFAITLLNWIFPLAKTTRSPQAFDFSSIAPKVFNYAAKKKISIGVVGGETCEVARFCDIVTSKYSGLTIIPLSNGYATASQILNACEIAKSDIYLLSCGSFKQEDLALSLNKAVSKPVFTCGAFVSQTAGSTAGSYYPRIIVKLNLRWLYRFYREPRVIRRVIKFYPQFLVKLLKLRIFSR